MRTFKALAALLEYPEPALLSALDEITAALAEERLLNEADIAALQPLFAYLGEHDLIEVQEAYVELFDRARAVSLNLFEHIHGETRDRGQAMVDLNALYASQGLVLAARQLPDYLPVFLEYLASRPLDEARQTLAETAHVLEAIGSALAGRRSPYAAVFLALLRLAGESHPEQRLAAAPATSAAAAADDPEALDREWVEAPVDFLGACAPSAARTNVIHFHKGAGS